MHSRTVTSSGRTRLRTAVCVLAAACAFLVAACGTSPSSTPRATRTVSASAHPPSIAPPSTATSTSRTHTYTYRSTTKGCDLISLGSLAAALGGNGSNFEKPNYERTAIGDFARCDRQYGAPGARSLVSIQIMIAKPAAASVAEGYWTHMRTADAKDYTLTTDPELAAQGAYGWTDDQIGPHLTVYDGNLYLRISINQGTHQTVPANRVTELLNEIARNAMSTMAS